MQDPQTTSIKTMNIIAVMRDLQDDTNPKSNDEIFNFRITRYQIQVTTPFLLIKRLIRSIIFQPYTDYRVVSITLNIQNL